MRKVFFNIETIPAQDPAIKAEIFARPEYAESRDIGPIAAAANLKDPDKIAESIRERTGKAKVELAAANLAKLGAATKAWRDTARDGWVGNIACIGWAIHDRPAKAADAFPCDDRMRQSLDRFDERACIAEFLAAVDLAVNGLSAVQITRNNWSPVLASLFDRGRSVQQIVDWIGGEGTKPATGFYATRTGYATEIDDALDFSRLDACPVVLIGHNVRRFDIVFLWQRCVVLGIPIPHWLAVARGARRFSDECVVDIMELAGNTRGIPLSPSLGHLCRALGISILDRIDGSQVWPTYECERFSAVRTHCIQDVSRVRSAYRRMFGRPMLGVDAMVQRGIAGTDGVSGTAAA